MKLYFYRAQSRAAGRSVAGGTLFCVGIKLKVTFILDKIHYIYCFKIMRVKMNKLRYASVLKDNL